jgi:hypothetical protein
LLAKTLAPISKQYNKNLIIIESNSMYPSKRNQCAFSAGSPPFINGVLFVYEGSTPFIS